VALLRKNEVCGAKFSVFCASAECASEFKFVKLGWLVLGEESVLKPRPYRVVDCGGAPEVDVAVKGGPSVSMLLANIMPSVPV